jgi:hypothetical protein
VLHLRLISPLDRTDAVCSLLADTIGVTNVIVLAGAAQEPGGDVVMCDVAREAADHLVDELIALGIEQDG